VAEFVMTDLTLRLQHASPLIAAVAFGVMLVAEHVKPLRGRTRPFLGRLLVNICVTAPALLIGAAIGKFLVHDLAIWADLRGFGLLQLAPLPTGVQVLLGFLLMDLTFYYWHMANHKMPLLWRFHNVHHVDPDLDVTTSYRFHWMEIAYSAVFRALQVCLLGVLPVVYFAYEIVFLLATMFHHSNTRLPLKLERILNKVVVTPRMHGIHHSAIQEETDSNYSVVFRWWDALHRTLRLNIRQAEICIGVPAYLEPEDNQVADLLLMPFRKQRPYWERPDGVLARRDQSGLPVGRGMMLE
jgi:sterol desaturase/sphingolipid hydroxylase (fatty acid hydroxylase superfamily)